MESTFVKEPVYEVSLYTHDKGNNLRCAVFWKAFSFDMACLYAQSFRRQFSQYWLDDPSSYIVIRDFEFYNKPF